MSQPIRVKIDVTKINKDYLFKGTKGTYLDVYLYPTPEDQYGSDFRATQDIPKEAREAGEKGAILGNAKFASSKPAAAPAKRATPPPAKRPPADPDLDADEQDVPFNHEAHAPR